MTSLRKLRRRLWRWDRYAVRCGMPRPGHLELLWDRPLRGHMRAYETIGHEQWRRNQALPPHVVTRWDLTEAGLL